MFLLSFLLVSTVASATVPSMVNTTSGVLTGVRSDGVTRYLGVPYAQSPVGHGRFRPPMEVDDHGVVDATRYGPSCIQPPFATELMYPQFSTREMEKSLSEDCLSLNVFVPDSSSEDQMPVMVWIPGDGFNYADASEYDASSLARTAGVVVVTVNYRVGPFGFLSVKNESAPGNVGLLDVVESLRWIRKNAGAFGANSQSVTVFGHFSGAMVISMLLVSPKTLDQDGRPIFQRAILQSGLASDPYTFDSNPNQAADQLMDITGCREKEDQELRLKCLRDIPGGELLTASLQVPQMWRPVMDPNVVPDDPLSMVHRGQYHRDIDLILGETSDDGSLCLLSHYYLQTPYYKDLKSDTLTQSGFHSLVQADLRQYLGMSDPVALAVVSHEYLYSPPRSLASNRQRYFNFCTDLYFRHKAEQMAQSAARYGTKVYRYLFDHRPSTSPHPDFFRAAHGDELPFMFNVVGDDATQEEMDLATTMASTWGQFARTGDPNLPKNGIKWPRFELENMQYLRFTANMSDNSIESSRSHERETHFWTSVVPLFLRNER